MYFPSLEADLISELEEKASVNNFIAGETLLKKGQYFRSPLIVLEGLVKIYREDDLECQHVVKRWKHNVSLYFVQTKEADSESQIELMQYKGVTQQPPNSNSKAGAKKIQNSRPCKKISLIYAVARVVARNKEKKSMTLATKKQAEETFLKLQRHWALVL